MTALEQCELFPELYAGPSLAPATGSDPMLPEFLLGAADVRRLQSEGWLFHDGGLKLGNCYAASAVRGDERKPFFLADPDKYPDAWCEEPNS